MEKTITTTELAGMLRAGTPVTLLDVRRKDDFDNAPQTITNAEWKNPAEIDQWLPIMPVDKEVVIYCVRGGSVSQSVQQRLAESGLNARYVEGGLEALNKTNHA